ATSGISTLSLHDALPICYSYGQAARRRGERTARSRNDPDAYSSPPRPIAPCDVGSSSATGRAPGRLRPDGSDAKADVVVAPLRRSEEHTSELQSPCNLVC